MVLPLSSFGCGNESDDVRKEDGAASSRTGPDSWPSDKAPMYVKASAISDHSSLTIPGFWSSALWYRGCYPYPIHRHVKGKLSSSTLCDSGSPDGENKQQDCMLNPKHSSEVYKKTQSYLIPVKQENSTSTSLGSELYIIDCPKIMFCVPAWQWIACVLW